MCATTDRALLVEAEAIVSLGIPGARAARVPAGLMIVLPLVRHDGDLTCLYLRAHDGRLALADDGGTARGLAAAGREMADPSLKASLAYAGLRHDARTGEMERDIPGIEAIASQVLAMGDALASLFRADPARDRLAA